ncbi:metallophosphoesterase family protein [Dyadobacter sp. CY343]|uniref:purple acid phosphatase family protein n=1 Tax=Dyadobacter sp. CY343 TaxID=2907299 RepID=UPI001F46456F|nr:metallophosphoesterase family protein [Dyadobacter sp. CY343]MCE7058485.1 metallophosphoesterase family protein [Dyadobacter sp. CY343]
MKIKRIGILALLAVVTLFSACKTEKERADGTVKEVIDHAVTRLYKTLKPAELDTISERYILQFLSAGEREILATKFWTFHTNVPVKVSVMRDTAQKVVPFWLEEAGFKKTKLVVKNEEYTYEVWQKNFEEGDVELGINGFDKHRPVYFISVAPQKSDDKLEITHVYPSEYNVSTLKKGAFTYHDWDGLVLTEVPAELIGQTLFTTVRGRAREAHLVKAFRTTDTPSSAHPDQVILTWSGDPRTTVDVQWRTNAEITSGKVKYWVSGTTDTLFKDASAFKMEDRLLQNDRYIKRFTAKLGNLKPGTDYGYSLSSQKDSWEAKASFKTAADQKDNFSFIWFGDTHFSEIWGDMAQKSLQRHPETAFFSIAGDLVTTGLHRDDWDHLWNYSGKTFTTRPLMPVPGNHDSQDGLGAGMYKAMFSLPENGPANQPFEMTYSFEYQNALFLMLDPTLPVPNQTKWVEDQLKNSKAKWKFAMFHFPPYNFEEPYDEIMREWCSLFDKYHVDMVMNGHMHYYLRTKPMFAGKSVDSPSKGTIYTMSISIPGKQERWPEEEYAVKRYKDGPLYQHISIKGNKLHYRCLDPEGVLKDELIIEK